METPSAGILMGFVGIWPFVGEKTGDFNRIIHVINGYMGWLSTYSWYRVKSECVGVLESKRWAWICNKQYHVGMICYRYPNHWDPIGILRNVDPSMANFEPRHTMYLTYLKSILYIKIPAICKWNGSCCNQAVGKQSFKILLSCHSIWKIATDLALPSPSL